MSSGHASRRQTDAAQCPDAAEIEVNSAQGFGPALLSVDIIQRGSAPGFSWGGLGIGGAGWGG
jgi:hypothetical protein